MLLKTVELLYWTILFLRPANLDGDRSRTGLVPFLFGSMIFSPNYDVTSVVIDNPQLPGTRQNPENDGINYQPQLVSSISAINWSYFFVGFLNHLRLTN